MPGREDECSASECWEGVGEVSIRHDKECDQDGEYGMAEEVSVERYRR